MNSTNASRRRFTALVGAAVIGGLAGCGGDGAVESPDNGTELTGGETGTSGAEATTEADATGEETTEEAETTEETTTGDGEGPETTSDPAGSIEEGNAAVRIAHLSPDAPNVDIAVDGTTVLSDVPFDTVSSYLVLSPGSYQVAVTPTGSEEAVFEEEVEVEAQAYTIAAIGEASGENQQLAVVRFDDDVEPPASGSRARLVHAVPDAPAVDVVAADSAATDGGTTTEETTEGESTTGEETTEEAETTEETTDGDGTTLFESVEYGTASEYAEVEAGDYMVEVRPAEGDGEAVATSDLSFEDGTVVTAFATGYLEPADAPADEEFGLTVTVDSGGDSE